MKKSVRSLLYKALENELDARQTVEFNQLLQNNEVREAWQQGLALREKVAQTSSPVVRPFFAERVVANWRGRKEGPRFEMLNLELLNIFRRVALTGVIGILILFSLNILYNKNNYRWDTMLKNQSTPTEVVTSEFNSTWEEVL